jgi:hypothetical protein
MRFKYAGNKYDIGAVVIKNNDTVVLKNGAPVILDFGATTEKGAQVKTSNSLALVEHANFFGIALSDIAVNAYGEAQVFGYNAIARTVLTTRTATNATWASIAAGSICELMTIGSGTGISAESGDQALIRAGLSMSGTYTGAASSSGQFSLIGPANAFAARLAETFASTDTQASSLGPQSQTIWTSVRKVFLRSM